MTQLTEKDGGKMETFWIAETLKYLLLLFSDRGMVDLESIVFTTEAHPMQVFGGDDSEVANAGIVESGVGSLVASISRFL